MQPTSDPLRPPSSRSPHSLRSQTLAEGCPPASAGSPRSSRRRPTPPASVAAPETLTSTSAAWPLSGSAWPASDPLPLAVPALVAGRVLAGRYQLEQILGEGGMGVVWRARSMSLDLDVAVKLIRPESGVQNGRERLLREARVAARVVHPGAARVLDFGVAEGDVPFLVMELIRGRTLASSLRSLGPLPPLPAVLLMLPVLGALEVAHRHGIVHRDVKPGNILLAVEPGRVIPKLIDFGIAAVAPSAWASKLAAYAPLGGSPLYMAPEQGRSGGDADPRTDVWGASLSLYEAVLGATALDGRRASDLARLRRPAALAAEPELWAIMARGLEQDPAARWPSARTMASVLARWAAARGATCDATGIALADLMDPARPS